MANQTPAYQFGEYPLHLVENAGGGYSVEPEDIGNADLCGIPVTFDAERLDIMIARGLAYGYAVMKPTEEVQA